MARSTIALLVLVTLLASLPTHGFAGSGGGVDSVPPPPRPKGGGGFNASARTGGGGFDDRPLATVKHATATKK
jgi:hypothetical protein